MRKIDADAVYKILESCEIRKATIGNPLTDWEYGYTCGIERAESEVECAPTVEAEPKAVNYICTGYADGQPVYDEAECPCCGRIYEEGDMAWCKAKYCMDCGQPLLWDEEEE